MNFLRRLVGMLGVAVTLGAGIFFYLGPGVPKAQAACSALPSSNGTVSFTINAPTNATYRFWAHIYSPSSGNNAVYLQIDDTLCNVTVGNNNAMPVGQFTWVDYQNGSTSSKINVTLSAGAHTVTMAGLDAGVGVDKVMLLSDTACTPTGTGDNCVSSGGSATPTPTPTPSPTVVVTPVPGASNPNGNGGTPVSGTIDLPKPADDVTRQYLLDGKKVDGDQVDTTKLENGTHTLKIVETDAAGKVTVTEQKLVVNNPKDLITTLLDVAKKFWWLVLVLLLLSGAAFAAWRFRAKLNLMVNKLLRLGRPAAAPDAPVVNPMTPPHVAPPTTTFMPDKDKL